MLISKNDISIGDIASFKLTNGEEVVARIKDITNDAYVLSKPCSLVPGQQGVMLVPMHMASMFSIDPESNIEISRQHVMIKSPTVEQLQNHYIKTTTGIEPVTRGGIVI
jgi:hypothetical protein